MEHAAFYATAAQVTPLLLLALVFELRLLGEREEWRHYPPSTTPLPVPKRSLPTLGWVVVIAACGLSVLAIAVEAACLVALASDRDSGARRGFVMLGLSILALLVMARLIERVVDYAAPALFRNDQNRFLYATITSSFIAVVGAALVLIAFIL